MKKSINNRDTRIQWLHLWLSSKNLTRFLPEKLDMLIKGYATYSAKQACIRKYGKVHKEYAYYEYQLNRQLVLFCHDF